jgi:uncharacterized membrane protein YqjE
MDAVSRERHADEPTLGELLGNLTTDVQRLLRAEVELAKVETREELSRVADAGKYVSVALGTAVLAVFLLSFAAAWGLAEIMPVGVAFLIVGVVYAAVAVVTGIRARDRARTVHPVPEQTIETLKEDVQWAKTRAT